MNWRRWLAVTLAVAAVWLGLAYCAGPPDDHAYRRTAVQAAQAALNAVRTAALTGDGHRAGKLVATYESVLLDDAAGTIASAQSQLAAQAPPDPATRRVRDQLAPLLGEAARQVGDLDLALAGGDRSTAGARITALRDLGDRLDDFVSRYR